MIIGITGSVGSGKTSLAKRLSEKLSYPVLHLNDIANQFKTENIEELQTFDFDFDKLKEYVVEQITKNKNLIVESHFTHFLPSELFDLLLVINRPLEDLREEYAKREYNEQKIKDNLEVESFNLCFYEALEEGFEEEKQVFCFENNGTFDDLVDTVMTKF